MAAIANQKLDIYVQFLNVITSPYLLIYRNIFFCIWIGFEYVVPFERQTILSSFQNQEQISNGSTIQKLDTDCVRFITIPKPNKFHFRIHSHLLDTNLSFTIQKLDLKLNFPPSKTILYKRKKFVWLFSYIQG
jgi:hypothetical protein